MSKARWKSGSRVKNRPSAKVAADEIERIDEKHGAATAECVVDESKPKKAPLHQCFTWEDDKAGRQWRVHEARMLINSIEIVIEQEDQPDITGPAFVNVTRGDGYRPIKVVMECEEMRETLLDRARGDLNNWRRRYGHLKKLASVVEAIDSLD